MSRGLLSAGLDQVPLMLESTTGLYCARCHRAVRPVRRESHRGYCDDCGERGRPMDVPILTLRERLLARLERGA